MVSKLGILEFLKLNFSKISGAMLQIFLGQLVLTVKILKDLNTCRIFKMTKTSDPLSVTIL